MRIWFVSALMFCPVLAAEAGSFYVRQDGTGDFLTIQEAITASSHGDEIHVAPGTYPEHIDFLGKAIEVVSLAGPEDTLIVGSSGGPVVKFTSGEGRDSLLQGFTLQGGTGHDSRGGGIYCVGTSPTIAKNILQSNFVLFLGGGVYCANASPLLVDTIIRDNLAGSGGGIYCTNFSHPEIRRCQFFGNAVAERGSAIAAYDDSQFLLVDSLVANNYGAGTIYLRDTDPFLRNVTIADNSSWGVETLRSNPQLDQCILHGNEGGAILGFALARYSNIEGGWPGEGNLDADPLFRNPSQLDYSLLENSPSLDAGDPLARDCQASLGGTPRRLASDPGQAMVMDQGAMEFSRMELNASFEELDSSVTIHTVTPEQGIAFLLVGTGSTANCESPFGTLWIDFSLTWILLPWPGGDQEFTYDLPGDPADILPLYFQGLVMDGHGWGNASRQVLLEIPVR